MFDTRKMIKLIRGLPALWDPQSNAYGDAMLRKCAWSLVGSGMYDDWEQLSDAVQQSRINVLKNKWKNVRDHHVKYRNSVDNGKPKSGRGYIYKDALSFLKDVEKRQKSEKVCDSPNSGIEFLELNNSSYYDPLDDEAPTPSTASSTRLLRSKIPKMEIVPSSPYEQQLLPLLDVQQDEDGTISSNEGSDPDKEALLSLLPDYKNLTREQKFDFRIHALQFFRNVFSPSSNCTSDSTLGIS